MPALQQHNVKVLLASVRENDPDRLAGLDLGQPSEYERLSRVSSMAVHHRVTGGTRHWAGVVPADVPDVVRRVHCAVAVKAERLDRRVEVQRGEEEAHGRRGRYRSLGNWRRGRWFGVQDGVGVVRVYANLRRSDSRELWQRDVVERIVIRSPVAPGER